MTTIPHELIYNLDGNGMRIIIAKDYTGTSVFCYELAMRKSTNQLTKVICIVFLQQFKNI